MDKKYTEIINLTAIYPQTVNNFGKMYSILGLIEEIDELAFAYQDFIYGPESSRTENLKKVKKELGDVTWYIRAISIEFNIKSPDKFMELVKEKVDLKKRFYSNSEEILDDLLNIRFHKILGALKKYYRDDKKINNEIIEQMLLPLCSILSELLSDENIELEEILEINYTKLIKRKETGTISGDGDNREEVKNE